MSNDTYTPEPKWGTIEQKDANGNVLSSREGLVIGRGDSKRVISPEDVEDWAETGATYGEMATYFGVKEQTFKDNFRYYVLKGRALTKKRLRQAQYEAALKGNATMLIWLGKQMLNQDDEPKTLNSIDDEADYIRKQNTEGLQPLPLGNDIPEELKEK